MRVAVTLGRPQAAPHRRRAAGAQGSAGADSQAGGDPGHRGPGPDHQRRPAGPAGPELYDAGLRRINVHLDTLDRERFKQITRRDDLDHVLEGIETRQRLGFGPIKINAVAVKNLVEPDIVPLARFGRERDIEIRYIEFMPLDAQGMWERDRVLIADDMIEMLQREIGPLDEIPDRDPRAPATEYRFADGAGASASSRRSAGRSA